MSDAMVLNRFKRRIRDGQATTAMWMRIPSTTTVRNAAASGADAVFVDMEHSSVSVRDVEQVAEIAEILGIALLVRPPFPDSQEIGRLLDCGAHGIIFPQVSDPDCAAACRARLLYPPAGVRGWGGRVTRAMGGNFASRREAAVAIAEGLTSIFLIEAPAAVEQIDEILERGRPDGVAFGWSDYAASVDFDVAQSIAAAKRVHDACRARAIGIAQYPGAHHGLSAEDGAYPWFPGCFTIAGADSEWLAGAIEQGFERARAVGP